jgi:hypothetical protein
MLILVALAVILTLEENWRLKRKASRAIPQPRKPDDDA